MSSRHLVASAYAKTLAALAVRLNMATDGRFKLIKDVVADAEAIHAAAVEARFALSCGKSARKAYAKAHRIAKRYDASVFEAECGNETPLVLHFATGPEGSIYSVL